MWNLIKQDYIIDSADSEEETDLPSSSHHCLIQSSFPSPPQQLPHVQLPKIDISPTTNGDLKDMLTAIQTDLKMINYLQFQMGKKNKLKMNQRFWNR